MVYCPVILSVNNKQFGTVQQYPTNSLCQVSSLCSPPIMECHIFLVALGLVVSPGVYLKTIFQQERSEVASQGTAHGWQGRGICFLNFKLGYFMSHYLDSILRRQKSKFWNDNLCISTSSAQNESWARWNNRLNFWLLGGRANCWNSSFQSLTGRIDSG